MPRAWRMGRRFRNIRYYAWRGQARCLRFSFEDRSENAMPFMSEELARAYYAALGRGGVVTAVGRRAHDGGVRGRHQ